MDCDKAHNYIYYFANHNPDRLKFTYNVSKLVKSRKKVGFVNKSIRILKDFTLKCIEE